MLAIRLQRRGHKGQPVYRVIIQEAHRTPTSGKVVAYAGSYNPHTKENKLDIEIIEKYLTYGAQPSPRVVKLLIENKVKLPEWVEKPRTDKAGKIRFEDKLRKNQPKEEVAEESSNKEIASEDTAENKEKAGAEEEKPAEEKASEAEE